MHDHGNGEVAPLNASRVERRRPFVPGPDRVVYPVDHVTAQQAALEKFKAEHRIVVGGQLTTDYRASVRSRRPDTGTGTRRGPVRLDVDGVEYLPGGLHRGPAPVHEPG